MIPTYDSFDWFSSLFPLLLVLVPVVAIVAPGPARRALFALTGVYLLYLIAPRLALFYVVFWAVMAVLQPVVSATGERRLGLPVLWGSLAICLAPLVLWKVWPIEFVVNFNVWTNGVLRSGSDLIAAIDMTSPIIAPIGLSFGSFRAADLLIKSNLGLVDRLTPGRVFAYGLFPTLLVVGPIATYDETESTLEARVPVDRERALRGTSQILGGLFKVFVVAYLLSWSADIFKVYQVNSTPTLWLTFVAFIWYFYVNFDGYSDMAIGTSRLLGADLRPNFESPYTKTNPATFWNSWHISLTRFLRTNVFLAIVGRHVNRQFLASMVTMVLIGLWHSVTWASVVYGVYHGTSLVCHRLLERRRPPSQQAIWRYIKPVGVFFWFGLSLPLLYLDVSGSIAFYAALIGVDR